MPLLVCAGCRVAAPAGVNVACQLRTRRELSGRDQRRVQRATRRCQPVSAAGLALAQLAYLAYARDVRERTPRVLGRWLRIMVPALYALIAAGCIVDGLGHSSGPATIAAFAGAALSAALAVAYAVMPPRFLGPQPARLDWLLTQINDRFGSPPIS